jgi:hypothetical protein
MRHVTAVAVTLAAVVLCSAVRAQDSAGSTPLASNFLIFNDL